MEICKRLVVCCDGTWNTPEMMDRGVPSPTNVVKLYNAVPTADPTGVPQVRYYHPGVGTDPGLASRVFGGAFGEGLDRNIKSAYRSLCDDYEPGADIYLFGFSRGAYTVRSLAGFVGRCGLIDLTGLEEDEVWRRIDEAFDRGYRKRLRTWRDRLDWSFHQPPDGHHTIPIRFIGVWDTVGALGVPDELAIANLFDNPMKHAFHDTELGAHIQTARHAVAMDEMRQTFQATLWTNVEPGRDVKQIWFPGNHGDVGGGHKETGLSDGALEWMIEEAEEAGLYLDPSFVAQIIPDYRGVLHRKEDGIYAKLPTMPRSVPMITDGSDCHLSARRRQKEPPISQAPYRQPTAFTPGTPITIDIFANRQWNETGLYLLADQSYTFSAEGEWLDAGIRCTPDGPTGFPLRPGRIFQAIGTLGDKVEPLFRTVGRNPNGQILYSKRHGDMPWFCLVGAIANGYVRDQKVIAHESFRIGSGPVTYTPRQSGYFYAYANDAWGMYGNNRGRVRLTVS